MTKITPINCAEAIIEPFWDPQLSGLKAWEILPGEQHGLNVWQEWCWVAFEWARRPTEGAALSMSRQINTQCQEYDRLLISLMPPAGSIIKISVETDHGLLVSTTRASGGYKQEIQIDLQDAHIIYRLTIELLSQSEGVQTGWINWIGLQNNQALPLYLNQWAHLKPEWNGYLLSADYSPQFQPAAGLLVNSEELAALQRRHTDFVGKTGTSPFIQAAQRAAQQEPEQLAGEFVNFWGDTRYCRERDHDRRLLGPGGMGGYGVQAAVAGLLLKDTHLLRLGARYALSLAICTHWDDGFICDFPGGVFEHRCFVQSLVTLDIALVLDLAGELFTPLGRDFLMRRIAEEGLGSIRFNTWKHEYIFHNNQLAWFSTGRIAGAVLLEKTWPRAGSEVEQAYQDLIESLGYAILPDGGYVEGPSYFTTVANNGGLALYLYGRSRKKDFSEIVPSSMRRTGDFAVAIASTDMDADVIPICDSGARLDLNTLAVMASLLPGSQWQAMRDKALARTGGLADSLFSLALTAGENPPIAPMPPFIYLPEMGVMASTRFLNGEPVKLFIMGNQAGAGHTHEDKGSFVLEFAGDTFAMDPGTCDYASPLANLLKNCERHNMLVPYGIPQRPAPPSPLPFDVKPRGRGDAETFQAEIDATPGWEGFYQGWKRRWNSPTPSQLIISDEYDLVSGDGVFFYWNTRLPVTITGKVIEITGRRGFARLTAPTECAVSLEELPMLDGKPQQRIAIQKAGRCGKIDVTVSLVTHPSKRDTA